MAFYDNTKNPLLFHRMWQFFNSLVYNTCMCAMSVGLTWYAAIRSSDVDMLRWSRLRRASWAPSSCARGCVLLGLS